MTQAGALTVVAGLDLEAEPLPQAEDPAPAPLRLTVPLLLAAGWGALLTFSLMFLMEDGRAAPPERVAANGAALGSAEEAAPFEPARLSDRSAGTVRLVAAEAPFAVPAATPAVIAATTPASTASVSRPGGTPAGMPAERRDYVGTWGPTAQACGSGHRRGFLPATITEESARAGRTLCRFRDGRRDGIAWAMAADCSERGRRWTSQVRLLVDGDRLTWTSAKGASTYVRCGRRDG